MTSEESAVVEVAIDIAINAGYLLGLRRIRVENSRELVDCINQWAAEFEAKWKAGSLGDDYIDTVDRFANEKLTKAYGVKL